VAVIYRIEMSRAVALRLARLLHVIDFHVSERSVAFRWLPLSYLKDQPLAVAGLDPSNEESRYDLVNKLVRIAAMAGYERVVVAMDKVDEPTLISGDYEKMSDFVKPLWHNKLLQTPGIHFKMLLPAQIHRTIRKADATLLNTARLDKMNTIYPFTWSGSHLYEMLSERASVCRDEASEGDFDLAEMFDESVSREELMRQLEKTRIPRYASKFMNALISEACDSLLASDVGDGKPLIGSDMFHRISYQIETEIRNEAQDLLEIE
jgi:hypothetical protein